MQAFLNKTKLQHFVHAREFEKEKREHVAVSGCICVQKNTKQHQKYSKQNILLETWEKLLLWSGFEADTLNL